MGYTASYTVAVVRQEKEPSVELAERMRAVGDLIRRVRVRKQMSQVRLGEALHLSRKTVGLIEAGRRVLDQWEMDVLKQELELSDRAFYDPPKATQLVSEPLDAYLGEHAREVAAEAEASDRRLRGRRRLDTPPSSQP